MCFAVAASGLLFVQPGKTQNAGSFVALQTDTPGTAQSGHINVSGTVRVGGFMMPSGAVSGRVLTSNAS